MNTQTGLYLELPGNHYVECVDGMTRVCAAQADEA